MPVEFDIWDGIIALEMIGTYEATDIQTALLEALDDPRSAGAIGLLFNVSRSESLKERSAPDVAAMGYFLAGHSDRFGRRMAMVGHDDFKFGMMRAGSAVLNQQGVTSEVFRDEEAARKWLHRGQ
jgi:hypothetical protein